MPNQTNSPNTPSQPDESPVITSEETRLDRIADEAASRAAKREQRYDQAHDIFTK
jgi:hypothetical protein